MCKYHKAMMIPVAKNWIDYKASCYDDLNIENPKGAVEMVELPCEICWACTLVQPIFKRRGS